MDPECRISALDSLTGALVDPGPASGQEAARPLVDVVIDEGVACFGSADDFEVSSLATPVAGYISRWAFRAG